eukprot:4340600-Pyramimonas_sp.AAC.1
MVERGASSVEVADEGERPRRTRSTSACMIRRSIAPNVQLFCSTSACMIRRPIAPNVQLFCNYFAKGLWGVECILAVIGTGGPVQ